MLLIPASPSIALPSGPVEPGDVVAVYTSSACVGRGTWTGSGLAVSIWADDPYTDAVDGFTPGDALHLRVFDASAATVYAGPDVGITFKSGYDVGAGLAPDGVYIVAEKPAGPPPAPLAALWISEVDALTDGSDAFVEIQAGHANAVFPAATLAAFGPSGALYGVFNLSGLRADSSGLLVVRPEGATAPGVSFPGVAAFAAEAGGFALYSGPVPSDRTAARLDVVAYGSPGAGRAQALLDTLGQSVQYVDLPQSSAGRTGPGRHRLFYTAAPSPGAVNAATVLAHAPGDALAGFRLVSVPVLSPSGSPLTVADLAGMNPVQGVPGMASPEAPPNLWTGFDDAAGQFVAPASGEVVTAPGNGFLWYWSNLDGSSNSFVRSHSGVPVDDAAGGPYTWKVDVVAPSGHYLVGNPYVYPLHLAGVSVDGATLQTAFATWDPADGTWVDLFSDLDGQDVLPAWGGALAEVSASTAFTVSTSSAFVDPLAAGAPAASAPAAMVSFELVGELAGGGRVSDRSAHVRFVDGAETGWDVHDATKLPSPASDYALLAAVGTRDGAARRQRVLSLPPEAPATVPLAFTATRAGSFVVRWTLPELPAGRTADLVDLVTGARVDLTSAESYAFAVAEATPWADRFELRLARSAAPAEPTAAEPAAVAETFVGAPYPNPSSGSARLAVQPATPQVVSVDVFDTMGRRVAQTFSGSMASTRADVAVDLRGLAPGLYMVRVVGETFAETRRVTVVR